MEFLKERAEEGDKETTMFGLFGTKHGNKGDRVTEALDRTVKDLAAHLFGHGVLDREAFAELGRLFDDCRRDACKDLLLEVANREGIHPDFRLTLTHLAGIFHNLAHFDAKVDRDSLKELQLMNQRLLDDEILAQWLRDMWARLGL